jgi:uncharacterized protein with von Willebrand factor type A (vWA) domain
MAQFEYSKFDGSEQFSPQSADKIFDELTQHMLDWGDHVLDYLEQWEEEHPDVVDMLVKRGYVEKDSEGKYIVTPKGIRRVENKALEELFQIARKDKLGNLNMHETLKNALGRQGGGSPIHVSEEDLVVYDTEYQTSCATVVLLDMSGSMTRYGKYGQAKRVAMALQSLIRSRYQGDFLQVVGFYTYASPLSERELLSSAPKPVSIYDSRVRLRINLDRPPSFVPEHFTNIQAGLQFARRILRRNPAQNKQIIIVTDGEPTAHIEGREIVLIYPPAEQTARLTLAEAKRCSDEGLTISSFALVEDYFYLGLVNFVERLAQVTQGVAAFCNADDLGNMVLESFVGGRKRRRAM